MKGFIVALSALLTLGSVNVASAEDADTTLRLYWKDGLRMETSDKQFKFKIGGRIQNDWAWFDVDDSIESATAEHKNSVEFRRARLYIAGEVFQNVIFKAQYDFAGGDSDFKDVYIGLKNLGPLGTLRVGQMYESVGLEELTSSKYITFMERSLTSALIPGRNTGFALNNTCADKKVTWAVGVFRETDDFGDSDGADNWNVSTRVTGTPVVSDDALVHLGFSFRYGMPDDSMLRLRQRPSAHLAERWVDTQDAGADLAVDETHTFGGEFATVMGPASLQAEYYHMLTDAVSGAALDDPSFSGYYIAGSVFLTGESRPYDPKKGTFKRVKPNENFGKDKGSGAIELALRFSALDLNDDAAAGGELWDVTAGVNWYLNPNTRVMLNYVHAEVEDRGTGAGIADGDGDVLQTRFQIDF